MNKPIKPTSVITDPNVLLNKFIIFKYKDNESSLCYVYKAHKKILYIYNIYITCECKIIYADSHQFNIDNVNIYILNSFKECCYYNVYIF